MEASIEYEMQNNERQSVAPDTVDTTISKISSPCDVSFPRKKTKDDHESNLEFLNIAKFDICPTKTDVQS